MTIYGHTSVQFYIENAKSAPLFAPCPIREEGIPNRERFGTILAWVQAEHSRTSNGLGLWQQSSRCYAIAKVIKKDAANQW